MFKKLLLLIDKLKSIKKIRLVYVVKEFEWSQRYFAPVGQGVVCWVGALQSAMYWSIFKKKHAQKCAKDPSVNGVVALKLIVWEKEKTTMRPGWY